jgi:hypothetical protein
MVCLKLVYIKIDNEHENKSNENGDDCVGL